MLDTPAAVRQIVCQTLTPGETSQGRLAASRSSIFTSFEELLDEFVLYGLGQTLCPDELNHELFGGGPNTFFGQDERSVR